MYIHFETAANKSAQCPCPPITENVKGQDYKIESNFPTDTCSCYLYSTKKQKQFGTVFLTFSKKKNKFILFCKKQNILEFSGATFHSCVIFLFLRTHKV